MKNPAFPHELMLASKSLKSPKPLLFYYCSIADKNACRGKFQRELAAVDFRLLALHASRGCAEIAGLGFEPRTFLAAQPKLCARPLGQAGAAGSGGTDD